VCLVDDCYIGGTTNGQHSRAFLLTASARRTGASREPRSQRLEQALIMSFPTTVLRPIYTALCRHVVMSWYFCALPKQLLHLYQQLRLRLQLARLLDGDRLGGLSGLGADLLNGIDNVKTLDNLAEDDVLAVQPGGLDGADEELRAVAMGLLERHRRLDIVNVRSGAGVGHGEDTGASVLQVEVLVLELLAVDGLTTGALALVSHSSYCLGMRNARCHG
jgi:hypothetical protein